ncbi:RNA polymerase sigma factor [Cryptosporangium japonicum]|uniref:RNA polymerase sigma factor n=1 Tax=Cryptosporangium japonicum TaxID=80872 RepID=A0ABN0U5A2_9ACTN
MSVLVRVCGDIDTAEECVQDAFAAAVQRWPVDGVPPSPAGWLITTARNRAIDRARREQSRDARQAAALALSDTDPPEEVGPVQDDRLRLVFTCCHPALAPAARVALTLRLLGGLTTAEIARAFLVPEATMAARITRAKKKIAAARIPYRVPRDADLPDRLRDVLAVVYLVFNEGQLTRADLAAEAIRLGRLLVELMPDEPEARGLLALMLLAESRREARVAPDGSLLPLTEQDRSRWDRPLVDEGRALVRQCLRRGQPGPYQVQAAISAAHTDGPPPDWTQLRQLYDLLLTMTPTPVVALNRAVVIAELDGPAAALPLVEELPLEHYYLFHAVRADLLRRLGRHPEAVAAYESALGSAPNDAEIAFLRRRLADYQRARDARPSA